jgi:hypothetical protein
MEVIDAAQQFATDCETGKAAQWVRMPINGEFGGPLIGKRYIPD